MIVGIDARFYGPGSKGLGRYTQKLIEHLEKIDHVNKYVIFLRRDNFDVYVPKNKNFMKVVADYQWYSFSEQFFFPFLLYRHKCDIVHFPHFNVPLLYIKKFIVTIHDLILLRYPTRKATTHSKSLYWVKFMMYRIVIAMAIRRATSIIAVSYFTKDDICTQYTKVCAKINVIHEAAEIYKKSIQDRNIGDILIKYDIMKPYMLYVGNAYPHKNLRTLVDAFAQYTKDDGNVSNLILVGCDDYFYKELKKYITARNISNIVILYTINDELLQVLYQEAHFFVFPSLYEGFGLPPLEAQLMHIPVLSSNHPCMREILSESGALYCDASNVGALAQAMFKISSQNDLRADLVRIGYKNARTYSWNTMAIQTHNIYKKNLSNF